MPAVSEKQRKLFGIARGMQEGKISKTYSKSASKIAKTVSSKKVREFAATKQKKRWRVSDSGAAKM